GGTAGCVIAGRLAEDPTVTILVVEAGSSNEKVPYSAIPAGVSQILGTDADWNIQSQPCAQLGNREIHLARGKFLGGTSGCNGTLCIRGTRQDYDSWELEGWSGNEFFDYMSKAETLHSKPWFEANETAHGYNGPLHTAPHDPAPISNLVLESYQSKGLPLIPDLFTSGESSYGCGHAIRTVFQGVRSSAADYITKENVRTNIEVETNSLVNRVVLENFNGKLRATGIETQNATGDRRVIEARKEVILSAGAYGSPAVLLRSGIGPKTEVEKHGIKSRLDLPGVGKNLSDHLVS
ncbi:MAG: hypothetical protein Q9187_008889, partial [Circinaria calcarea]